MDVRETDDWTPKLAIWMNMPSHHQRHLFTALREQGIDLEVRYYGSVPKDRVSLGWSANPRLGEGEAVVRPIVDSVESVREWRDRIHIIPGYGQAFLRQLAIFLTRKRTRWIHWSEATRPGLKSLAAIPVKRWWAWLINRHALGAFAIGRLAAEDFVRWGVRREKIALLPYSWVPDGTEHSADTEIERFRAGRRCFVFAGSLYEGKAIDVILAAFAQLRSVDCEWCLVFIGDDRSGGEYRRLAERLGISQHVLFRGALPASAVPQALRSGSVLLLPSRWDGWGMALMEGAATGLALIASDKCGAAHHLIEDGQNGIMVSSGSVNTLYRAMSAYVRNPSLADLHGLHSAKVFARFTPAMNARRLVEAVRSWEALA